MSEFQKNEESITLKRYFNEQYEKEIQFDDQPIIESQSSQESLNYILPELCYPTGLTDEMRKDFRTMKVIASHTRMPPQQCLSEKRKLIAEFHGNDNVRDCLNYWGIRLAEDLANLAFKLCHLYYNWQGTVRVPAPCQYAHKLAFLTAQSLHGDSDEQLRDKLFFL